MKHKKLLSLFCAVVCMMTMVIPSFARASTQINDYWVDVISDDGQIYIDFSVSGTGTMEKIGCESIYIFEDSGRLMDSFDEDDTGMSRSNTVRHANTITADCDDGVRYRVIVTIFAEDSAGRDTRKQTFYVAGQA